MCGIGALKFAFNEGTKYDVVYDVVNQCLHAAEIFYIIKMLFETSVLLM